MSSSKKINYRAIFAPVDAASEQWNAAPDECFATEQMKVILRRILPGVLSRFVRKNADYGDTAKFLGARGQFADINPKFWKLKRALWDGDILVGESVEEILSDLVGHCLLTLYFCDEGPDTVDKEIINLSVDTMAPIDPGRQVIVVPEDQTGTALYPGTYQWDPESRQWVGIS